MPGSGPYWWRCTCGVSDRGTSSYREDDTRVSPDYLALLIRLGEEDAKERHDEIESFIRGGRSASV